MEHKFPGYQIDENYLVVNKNEVDIDEQNLRSVLLSKDLALYAKSVKN